MMVKDTKQKRCEIEHENAMERITRNIKNFFKTTWEKSQHNREDQKEVSSHRREC